MHSGYAYYIKGNILQINDINLAYESNAAGSCVAEIHFFWENWQSRVQNSKKKSEKLLISKSFLAKLRTFLFLL